MSFRGQATLTSAGCSARTLGCDHTFRGPEGREQTGAKGREATSLRPSRRAGESRFVETLGAQPLEYCEPRATRASQNFGHRSVQTQTLNSTLKSSAGHMPARHQTKRRYLRRCRWQSRRLAVSSNRVANAKGSAARTVAPDVAASNPIPRKRAARSLGQAALPNPSLKRSANGMPLSSNVRLREMRDAAIRCLVGIPNP